MKLIPLLLATALAAQAQEYRTVFYNSGSLRIEAYLYQPAGNGPFAVVIYNHGSRQGQERIEQPFVYIGRMLTEAGYAVIVPERRGYGKSDGVPFAEEVGADKGERFIRGQTAEADDVIAAADYLKTLPFVDRHRIGIMGWSFGGIVTVLAASRSDAFHAAIDQAGGSLSWRSSPMLQRALSDAASRIKIPLLCMVAENDATTAAVKSVYESAKRRNARAGIIVYPSFAPPQNTHGIAPGHLIFGMQGAAIWQQDVLNFLDKNLR